MAGPPVVTVVGSYAVGLVMHVDRVPAAGETRIGSGFAQGPGGKGSNQAIQAARLDARVALVAAIGDDPFGDDALGLWAAEGIDVAHIVRRPELATGVGFILVEPGGENRIVLDMGANEALDETDVAGASTAIRRSGAVIAQLEIPLPVALAAMAAGRAAGAISVLNPAPARPIPPEGLALVDVLTPNETELRVLAGRSGTDRGNELDDCRRLLDAGVGTVVLTRGEAGARIVRRDGVLDVPAPAVDVVDSTGAGDAFTATVAVTLAAGGSIEDAVARAVVAGALACTRDGVVPALAAASEIDAMTSRRATPG